MSVGPNSTEPVASGATPVTTGVSPVSDQPLVLRGFSVSLNGFSSIRALYGFSRKSLTHFLRSSPTSVPSWYDPKVVRSNPIVVAKTVFILGRTNHKHRVSFRITSPKVWLGLGCPDCLTRVRSMIKHRRQVHKTIDTLLN